MKTEQQQQIEDAREKAWNDVGVTMFVPPTPKQLRELFDEAFDAGYAARFGMSSDTERVIKTPVRYDAERGYIFDSDNKIVVDASLFKGLPNPQAEYIAVCINQHDDARSWVEKSPVELAELFHATYELLAPQFGYETREETREFDPESPNGKLMIAVCRSILDIEPPSTGGTE